MCLGILNPVDEWLDSSNTAEGATEDHGGSPVGFSLLRSEVLETACTPSLQPRIRAVSDALASLQYISLFRAKWQFPLKFIASPAFLLST